MFLSGLFIAAVCMKLLAAYYMGNGFHPKVWEYEEISTNIINGKGFLNLWDLEPIKRFNIHFRSLQEPFFPILCAAVYFLTNHSIFAMLMLQIFYTSLIPIVLFYISYRIYDLKTAISTGVFSLFLPGITFYSAVNLHHMPLYSLFFCLMLLFALKLADDNRLRNQLLLGVIFGVGFLIRSTTLAIMVFTFLWLWFLLKIEIKKKAMLLLRILALAVIIVSPWVIRNYYVHKKFVLFQTSDALCLYMATNPNATGTLFLPDKRFQLEGIPKEVLAKYDSMTEIQFRDLMKEEAWKYIKQDPLRIAGLSLRRCLYFWWFSPFSGRAPGFEYPERYIKLYKMYYFALLGIFLWQLGFVIRNIFKKNNPYARKEVLIMFFLLAAMLPHIILYPEGRHRFAIEPLLLIFVSRRIIMWGRMLL